MKKDLDGGPDIGLDRRGRAGIITLRRPAALNALTHEMILGIAHALDAWESDPGVALVLIRGEGRAFSAGGDIGHIYRAGRAGRPPVDFFADEYRLNARIHGYSKPYVALVDGMVMGGGVGVSVHGSHRVFTEKARFAMPEVSIGFFPDVGGSHFLPRLANRFGFWIGLSGMRAEWGDCLSQGIATHAVRSDELGGLVEDICETGDPDKALAARAASPEPETDIAGCRMIAQAFSAPSIGGIIEILSGDESQLAQKTLQALGKSSPTSLHVGLRQLTAGAALDMKECLAMEFRIVQRMLAGHDFYEGIRAAIIDKDGAPRWRPATLAEVDPAVIDDYFASLGEGELQFGDNA